MMEQIIEVFWAAVATNVWTDDFTLKNSNSNNNNKNIATAIKQ